MADSRDTGRPPPSRFTAPRRSAGFWVAMWTLAVAAEFGALVPIIFAGDAPVEGADVVYRLVGGSFAAFGLDRVAPAAGQPQRRR